MVFKSVGRSSSIVFRGENAIKSSQAVPVAPVAQSPGRSTSVAQRKTNEKIDESLIELKKANPIAESDSDSDSVKPIKSVFSLRRKTRKGQ